MEDQSLYQSCRTPGLLYQLSSLTHASKHTSIILHEDGFVASTGQKKLGALHILTQSFLGFSDLRQSVSIYENWNCCCDMLEL